MDGSMFIGTWWALIPRLLAIVLAFVTKEVYSSPVSGGGGRSASLQRVPSLGIFCEFL